MLIAAGFSAYVWRVLVRDQALPGTPHRVVDVVRHHGSVELLLEPLGLPLRRRPGQFVYLRLPDGPFAEPHPVLDRLTSG